MRICLVLQKTLGDIVIGNVLIKNIKLKYSSADIDWILDTTYNDLVKDNPNVTNIINLSDWDDVLRRICVGYDKVMVAQQTNTIDNLWHQQLRYNKSHLLDFYAFRCGIEIKDRKLELYNNSNFLHKENFIKDKPILAIHTKSLVNVKDWSFFEGLVEKVKTRYDIIQLGTLTDKEIQGAKKVCLPLEQVLEFFKKKYCSLFIGLDSGLSYISSAFNIPTIQIMGATTNITSGAWGDTVHTLLATPHDRCIKERNGIRCHGILQGNCGYGIKCIDKISINQVLEVILKL